MSRSNRRNSARYPAIGNSVILAWQDGNGPQQVAARLLNLSQSGALLVAEGLPPVREVVWIRLQEPAVTDWADALVVRTARSLMTRLAGKGPCFVRLRFLPNCPFEFFKLATQGKASDDGPPKAKTSEHEIGVWR